MVDTVGGVLGEADKVLVLRRSRRTWVGRGQEEWLCKKAGGEDVGVAIYVSVRVQVSNWARCRQTPKTKTKYLRALPGERVGPRTRSAAVGASGVRLGCVQLRRRVHSARFGVLWRLKFLSSCTVVLSVEDQSEYFSGQIVLDVVWNECAFLMENENEKLFPFFFFCYVLLLRHFIFVRVDGP